VALPLATLIVSPLFALATQFVRLDKSGEEVQFGLDPEHVQKAFEETKRIAEAKRGEMALIFVNLI